MDTLISYSNTRTLIKGQSLCEDDDGNIWIGTGYGVFVVGGGRILHLNTVNGLPNENVYNIMQDRERTMWFGTENGVAKLTTPRFLNYSMKEGLTGYTVLSMMEDDKRNIWVGMWNGLNRLGAKGGVTRWDDADGLQHHSILSIVQGRTGLIYAGSVSGVDLLLNDRVVKKVITGMRAQSMLRRSNGDIWIGSIGKIVLVRGGSIVNVIDTEAGIPNDYIGPLLEDRKGTLWFGTTRHGAGRYREGKTDLLNTTLGLPDNNIHSISQDDSGWIWICTDGGVAVWRETGFGDLPFVEPVLKQGPVYFAMRDSMHHLWFGTDDGLYEWTGSTMQHFNSRDGLSSDIVRHGLVAANGLIWFGTEAGVSLLDRSNKSRFIPPPTPYLDRVTAGDDEHELSVTSVVEYGDRSVTFRFNALSYLDEGALRFQWMMEGFDTEWQHPERQRQVRYTNLSPGGYAFVVKAENRNGGWSEPARFMFSIRPPYWRTWWFIFLCLAVVTSIVYAVHRYRLGQLLKVERMRTRIAADLHDDIASSLSSVALYSDVIRHQVSDVPTETQELLDRIRDLSRETMEKIGLIVWSVDPRRDEVSEVVTFFQRHAMQMCSAAGIAFDSPAVDTLRSLPLTPEQRRTVYLILKEGLNNIIRHAECSKVSFHCRVEDRTLRVVLTDDGRGFPAEGKSHGHGLQNMNSRAEAIGAQLRITSSPGKGTSLALTMRIA
jgi:two-component sensor histidine kinase